jgi:hypothetical protein
MRPRKRGDIVQRIVLKRLLTVVFMVLMVLAMAIPALADSVSNTGNATNSVVYQNDAGVWSGSGQQVESGDGNQTITISGNNK